MNVECITEIKSYQGNILFIKGLSYSAYVFGSTRLMTKDEVGCIREISQSKNGDWNDSKFFKAHFKIKE